MENVSTTCNVRVKRCSTLMNINHVSSAEDQKQNTSHDRVKERTSSQGLVNNPDLLCPSKRSSCSHGQCSNAMTSDILNACSCCELCSQKSGAVKAPDSPGDDISCISGLDTANMVLKNCSDDAEKKNTESGSSVSVNSFPSSQTAFNDSQLVLDKMSRNSEEIVNNYSERSRKGSEPCVVDSLMSPPSREPSTKGGASVYSGEKGEFSSTANPSREAAEISEHSETKCKEKVLSIDHTCSAVLPLASQSADIKTGSDLALEEVRVCDICGDVGREYLLAICTKCTDGAEHIYCMHIKMDKVPVGDWVCEDCKINQGSGIEEEKKVEEGEKVLKRSYSMNTTEKLGSSVPSNLKKRLQVDVGASCFEKKTANAVSCSPRVPSKISVGNSEGFQVTKKRSLETKDESAKGTQPQKKLTRDGSSSSTKNIAEGKVKPFPSICSPRTNFPVGKSRLLKSKSFNSGDTQVEDHQYQKSHERRSIGSKDNGKGGHSKTFCKSQSFKGALSKFSVPDVSKTKKIVSPTSPRVDDQMRVRQTEHHSSSAMKSVPKFGSSNVDDKRNAESGELTLKHSAAANHCDQKMIQGHEHLSDSLELRRCLPQKGPGDQHEENNRNVNKVKAESSCKAYELDANRSSRGNYLDYSVLCPGGVIPQVDIVWKGGFEVSRCEGPTNSFPCIQAHKSNHACDKVDAVVKKLPQKIILEEAPRIRMWPAKFKDSHTMEEDIALFFFAENLESYGAYKSLLERITVNDLALKGYLEGVELLIFSSKVLPPESQRWNNFLYMWGVFRFTSVTSPENEPTPQNKLRSPGHSTNNALLKLNLDGSPLPSPSRLYEISETVLCSSRPKISPVHAMDHQLSSVSSSKIFSPDGERDSYRSTELDLEFGKDNNTRCPAFNGSYNEEHIDRKMKAIANGLPEPCSQNPNGFFEVGPVFCHMDVASSSGAENINDAATRIPPGDEQSTIQDVVNLELSLGPMEQAGKRKALSLSLEALDDRTCPVKRLWRNGDEPSLSLCLSLAPPSQRGEGREI